ncbi:MAG: hypothetical protein HY926_11830 [Elusimicrobia bacterium]|nr:hypothetical protein [Elusimicrobiota bacterium]
MSEPRRDLLYRFTFQDGAVREFPVRLDPRTLKVELRPRSSYPDWTKLSFCRCPNCPFTEDVRPRCPTAESVLDVVEFFQDRHSYEKALVEIVTPARTTQKRAALSEGASSLLGLLMPTGGCPILGLLRPNVLTHLPFATIDETAFRTLAMYLLAQFFVSQRGGSGDWTLARIGSFIEEVHLVNRHFSLRLGSTCLKDANLNAVSRLDAFAHLTDRIVRCKGEDLAPLFDDYLVPPA